MLRKSNRVTTTEFNQYFKSSTRLHGEYIQVLYTPADHFKAAAVAGKKVYKKAVDRNRLRRRLYHALAEQKNTHNLKGIFLCIAKPTAAKATFSALETELSTLIGRIVKSKVE